MSAIHAKIGVSDATDDLDALWNRYCGIDAHAQHTGLQEDRTAARAAWHLWLCIYLPGPYGARRHSIAEISEGRVMLVDRPQELPPHNIEVEQALLGAILINNEAGHLVADIVEPKTSTNLCMSRSMTYAGR